MFSVLKLAIRDLLYHYVFYSHDSVNKISKIVTWTCLRGDWTGAVQFQIRSGEHFNGGIAL